MPLGYLPPAPTFFLELVHSCLSAGEPRSALCVQTHHCLVHCTHTPHKAPPSSLLCSPHVGSSCISKRASSRLNLCADTPLPGALPAPRISGYPLRLLFSSHVGSSFIHKRVPSSIILCADVPLPGALHASRTPTLFGAFRSAFVRSGPNSKWASFGFILCSKAPSPGCTALAP